MNYELKELSENMGRDVYEMYQDIPKEENGQSNSCNGLSYDEYKEYIKNEILRKNNRVTYDDTPTITYIMYVDNYPVGVICLRTELDDNWKRWSGNVYYKIRLSERYKGYGTKMLSMALDILKNLGFKEVFVNASPNNIGSAKVIENNGGILLEEVNASKYYEIIM